MNSIGFYGIDLMQCVKSIFPLIFFDSEKIGQNISERIDLLKETFLFSF